MTDAPMTPADFRLAREDLGLSQDQIAALLGVSVRTVQRWEGSGPIPVASATVLRLMLEGYRPDGWPAVLRAGMVGRPISG